MKKILTLVVALVMAIPMMAIGDNDGSTKANAIDFSWDSVMTHPAGTKWYRVDLSPLYEEETPALNLFLANKDPFSDANTRLKATVAGQTDEKTFTIHPKQQRVWSANATMLIRLQQKEIYLTLTSDREVKMSARVFEAQDLDETCTDALPFNWSTGITKAAGVPVWYKVNITTARNKTDKDVCVVVTNNGTSKLTLHAGQSLDCPSSGVTRRTIELEAGQTLRDTIPNSALSGMAYDELYVSLENNQPITVTAEYAERPAQPVMPADTAGTYYTEKVLPTERLATDTMMYKRDTTLLLAGKTYYFKYDVKKMNAFKKYEPEFTFRNKGVVDGSIDRKMAFNVEAYVAQGNTLVLAPEEESVEVLAKNTLIGLEADYIYVKMTPNQDMWLISRFKHIREGKACKTNIDFNWEEGHRQDALTTQWYAIGLTEAKRDMKDLQVYVENQGAGKATLKASLAFSCPYIDVQEINRSIEVGDTAHTRLAYSTYAMMRDTVYIGLETNQEVKFWVELTDAKKQAVADTICLHAKDFSWAEGDTLSADTTMWFLIDMKEARKQAALFPTIFVQNESSTAAAKITAELSLECPDSIENQKRSLTIEANGSYSKTLSSNMFSNIKKDTVYLKVRSTQKISMQIRLNKEAEGTSCSSAIPFNWTSGNSQKANENLWYKVDLRQIGSNQDLSIKLENKSNAACTGAGQLTLGCPDEDAPSVQNFTLAANEVKTIFHPHSIMWLAPEDSIIYINLQGSTALHISAERVDAGTFTPITGASKLDTLLLDTPNFTEQNSAEAWYIVTKEEVARVRTVNQTDPQTPIIHIENNDVAACDVTIEAAFGFPIAEKMLSQTLHVAAGTSYTHTLDYKLFMQAINKYDSILVRIEIPAGTAASGQFRFRSGMDQAYGGNTRQAAIPITLGKRYAQSPNTDMWYKLKTQDIKKDKTLYNKRLWVMSKNAGKGDAEVQVSVYEGLLSNEDLLESYGVGDYRKRTIKKGQGKSHDIPAQAVYAVGDGEFYILVRTTDSLVFETRFDGEYAPLSSDSLQSVAKAQSKAKLLVPNVEYELKANQETWFMACIPYLQNNYIYSDSARLIFEVNGATTVEGTFTFQDTMKCKMPVKKRSFNKGTRTDTIPVRELIEKGIKKAGYTFDFTGTAPSFMDSLLHRYITKDSITGYLRLKSSKDLKVKLLLEQKTGMDCGTNPMAFDWEHGNVNAAGTANWYHVRLDSLLIPDTCDLRLHVDNWSELAADSIDAALYFDCNDPATKTKGYKLAANGKDSIDIDRDLMDQMKWADLIIDLKSTQATHIWAEFIPDSVPEPVRDTIERFVCQGSMYTDSIIPAHSISSVDAYTTWYDTVSFQDGVMMRDSIVLFKIHPVMMPDTMDAEVLKAQGLTPLLVKGMELFTDSSNHKLTEYYRNLGNTYDTIMHIDTVYWARPVWDDPTNPVWDQYDDTDENPLGSRWYEKTDDADTLLLVIKAASGAGECSNIPSRKLYKFSTAAYKTVAKDEYVCAGSIPSENPKTTTYLVTDSLQRQRKVDTIVTYNARVFPTLYTQAYMKAQNAEPIVVNGKAIDVDTYATPALLSWFATDVAADQTLMSVTGITWEVKPKDSTAWQALPYTVLIDEEGPLSLRYTITTGCGTTKTSDDFTYTLSPCPVSYGDTTVGTGVGADSYVCDSYTWHGKTYKVSGNYNDTLKNACGNDSIVTLHLTIHNSTSSIDPVEGKKCTAYYWADADTTITTIGTHDYTHKFKTIYGCDSVVTKTITVYKPDTVPVTIPSFVCNVFEWKDAAQGFDTTIIDGGTNTYRHKFINQYGCDSIVDLTVTIKVPYETTLDLKAYYGDRIIMINRNQINAISAEWQLDSLGLEHPDYVEWYYISPAGDTTFLDYGYYYTLASGDPLPAGQYFAKIDLPAVASNPCGALGQTIVYTVTGSAAAPALVPSLARPGEEVHVINLDPTQETMIRVYTTEGLLHASYKAYGETSYTIKAANDHGFYLVELSNESMKTTLRYIVK